MAKLSNLKPKLSSMGTRLTAPILTEHGRDQHRAATQPWRKWYKTALWTKLRAHVLLRDNYTCTKCKRIAFGKGQAIADHIRPHRGNEALFFDPSNIQCLCKPCHDSVKQAEEASMPKGVWY